MSIVWRQLDTLVHICLLAHVSSIPKTNLEFRRTYDFLTRPRDDFEPLRAQLLASHPCVSLITALLRPHGAQCLSLCH